MENPAHWTKVERIINQASIAWDEAQARGVVGASRALVIANALRKEGLINEEANTPAEAPVEKPQPAPEGFGEGTHEFLW